tara:strand:- start:84 stop:218 length:135 start_codon:yes stop_codon:yes gene_type:complete
MVDQAITHIPITQLADLFPNGADAIGTLIWLKISITYDHDKKIE